MNDRRLWTIAAIIFTNLLGAGSILPILPLYAEGQFQATILQATLLGTSFFAAQFLAAPTIGRLSDRFGRRPVLIISQIGTVFSFVLFTLAGPIGLALDAAIGELLASTIGITGGLLMLYVARILDGITGGNITVAQAYVSDISTERERAQALGMLSAALGLGFVFGPVFGGLLATVSPVAPFIGAAIITAGTATLTTITLPESLPPEKRTTAAQRREPGRRLTPADVLAQPALVVLILIGFLETLAFSAIPQTFAFYADAVLFPETMPDDRVAFFVGLMLAFFGIAAALTQAFALKPLVTRYRERNLIVISIVTLMLLFLVTPLTSNPWLVTLGLAPFAFARGITQPSEQSLITRFGSDLVRGQLLGIFQSGLSLGFIFGPIWGGAVFQAIRPQAIWLVGALIMVPALVLALILRRLEIPQQEPEDEPPAELDTPAPTRAH